MSILLFGTIMEYMQKWKRPLLFWSFAILFLVTVPVILLRARGYRFDFHRGVFVYSGTITFKSNPQSVSVKLNGTAAQSKQLDRINASYNISALRPKTYHMEISAPGFNTWTKTVDVHSGVSTEFWNVLLTRKDYSRTEYDPSGLERFFISPKNKFIAYSVPTDNQTAVGIFDLGSKKTVSTFDLTGWNFAGTVRKENIEWSPDENYISVPVKKTAAGKTAYDYFMVNLADGTQTQLSDFLGKDDISHVRWDSKTKGYFFFLSGGSLYRADLKTKSDTVKIADNVSAYDLSGSYAYYATVPNNLLFKESSDGSGQPAQLTSSFPGDTADEIENLVVYDDTRISLITKNQNLYIFNQGEHNDYFRQLDGGVLEAHFSDDGKKLLFWSENEISVYYLRDELSQPNRTENTLEDITRYSQPVKNVQWLNDYEHIIFTVGKSVKVIELDPRDHRNCMDIIELKDNDPFVIYDGYLEKLFFTDQKDSSTALYSIDFPEKTSILSRVGLGG